MVLLHTRIMYMSPLIVKSKFRRLDHVREQERRRKNKELDSIIRWPIRDWVSAIYWKSKLVLAAYFRFDDRSPWYCQNHYVIEKVSYHSILLVFSAGTIGTGLGQILTLLGR